jgi:two-component system, LuxR family, response regulator FixJ
MADPQMANQRIVHVVDDDDAMRESLATLLEDAGHPVRAYASAEAFLAAGGARDGGCVVSDVRMPGMDGLALLRHLRASGSACPLILITAHGDVPLAVAAMKAGAVDFIEKPFEAEALLSAVQAGLRQRRGNTAEADPGEAARRRLEVLTPREAEVLERLIAGESNKVAAATLGISPRTVEFHRARVMEKTGARGLPDLVRLWLAARPD